jgi:hypothetical protein
MLTTYNRGRKRPRVIGQKSHFRAIKTLLVEDSLLEFDRRVRIIVEPRVVVPGITLRLRSRAAHCLNPVPPGLFGKIKCPIRANWYTIRIIKCSRTHHFDGLIAREALFGL